MNDPRPNWMAPERSRVSTFVVVPDAMRVARFAEAVFDAAPVGEPLYRKDGALWNHGIRIGECSILLGDAQPGMNRPGFLHIHVPDVDATFARAVESGARPVMHPDARFYGDRDGGAEDMAGNLWWIATHERDLTPQEIERAARAEEEMR